LERICLSYPRKSRDIRTDGGKGEGRTEKNKVSEREEGRYPSLYYVKKTYFGVEKKNTLYTEGKKREGEKKKDTNRKTILFSKKRKRSPVQSTPFEGKSTSTSSQKLAKRKEKRVPTTK